MSKQATVSAKAHFQEPYLLYLVFLGVGLGTALLQQPVRLALLWSALVVLGVLYRSNRDVPWDFSLLNVERGALLGLVISVPPLALLSRLLQVFNERLYMTQDIVLLFYQVCFIAAPVEEYFFRGILQERLGSSVTVALYALLSLVYFLPHAPLLVTFMMFLAMGVLGFVYGYVREHYGLAASVACHAMVALVLQVLPSLIAALRLMLS